MRLSRAQLHELVWSKPMTEIARQFGVRDQHIARACDDADISRPPAGYWQKIGHGKVVPRGTLSNDRFAVGDMIVIEVQAGRSLSRHSRSPQEEDSLHLTFK